jgi:TetR/AcrR family transcriptional regulator, ethionamide resistance regulator
MNPVPIETKPSPRSELVEQLRDAVEQLLVDSTYAEIKVDDLVDRAGLAKSTFYVYFDDKADLLSHLADRVISELVAFDGAWWTLPPEASKGEIRDAIAAMFEAYLPHGLLIEAISAAAIYDPRMRNQFTELLNGVVENIGGYLQRGQQAGAVPTDLDPEHTAFSLAWMFERGFNLIMLRADPRSRKRKLDAITEIVWRTCHGDRR